MRRNLSVRLLGLFLGVAVFSIAATAWIATSSTSDRLRDEVERTLSSDTLVYQELLFYAQSNDSWDDVDSLVRQLADTVGNRVAVTTPDGEVLADSAALSDDGGEPLPSTPTADIDPLAPQQLMGVASASTVSMAGDGAMVWSPTPELPLTTGELEVRSDLAVQATACAQAVTDDTSVFVGADGAVKYGDPAKIPPEPTRSPTAASPESTGAPDAAKQPGGAAGAITTVDVLECVPVELSAPSAADREVAETQATLTATCMDEAGVPVERSFDGYGLPVIEPPAHDDPMVQATWARCSSEAQQQAMEPHLADPALLYIGSSDRFDAFSGGGWLRTALTGLAVLAAATGVTVLAGRRLTHPIRTLTAAAQRMASGGRGARVRVTGRDELARLGHAFNAMASAIEENERQRKAMVSDIAHELRTPLANVRGYLEAAEDGVVPLDRELVSSLLEESSLLQRLIDDLQDLALADAGMLRLHPEETDVAHLARQVAAAHGASAAAAELSLTVEAADCVVVDADPTRLRQALGNLVSNAVQYSGPGARVRVRVSRTGDDVVLAVTDDGPGIAAEHLDRLFDRFYRTDTSRTRSTGGSGLGLSITKHLVEAHGGTVAVDSTEGSGSTFTIRLPVRAPVPAA
ncbi:ATP-binding protein [Jiangella asiatica]|uniref:histidine kinase n=1 Tax=Jiangella asiatica TaxID=2530372 RepID=A0A4R5D9V2_9ACTN|nr:ATP-binding protein [Jiangella asiatica]TDE08214.1 HAMP domain-containing protein [Jiangella asiatica]